MAVNEKEMMPKNKKKQIPQNLDYDYNNSEWNFFAIIC